MARNEEKHYGRLNRLLLLKEKEEYEKKNPKRPKLDLLNTVEEIQMWLPSIKRDMDFYLKKSKVVCYSDQHIEECKMQVVKFEKEYKAFVRKLHQLSCGTLAAIPWTNRPYKRKHTDPVESKSKKGFVPIACRIIKEVPVTETTVSLTDMPFMNEPLSFNLKYEEKDKDQSSVPSEERHEPSNLSSSIDLISNISDEEHNMKKTHSKSFNIVNYDNSSESEDS